MDYTGMSCADIEAHKLELQTQVESLREQMAEAEMARAAQQIKEDAEAAVAAAEVNLAAAKAALSAVEVAPGSGGSQTVGGN